MYVWQSIYGRPIALNPFWVLGASGSSPMSIPRCSAVASRGTGSMHSWSKARSALDLNAWAKEPL